MFEELLERLAGALERVGIDYMIIGGQAVLLYGEARLTKDIDITLGVGIERLKEAVEVADEALLRRLTNDDDFTRQTMVLPCIDTVSDIRVDLILSNSEYELHAFRRVRKVRIRSADVHFASPEDVIIHKMVAGRPRDIEDVQNILSVNPDLDKAYIRDLSLIHISEPTRPY